MDKYFDMQSHFFRRALMLFQLILSSLSAGLIVWRISMVLTKYLVHDFTGVLEPWTFYFYNPSEAQLITYLVFSAILGIVGLIIYLLFNEDRAFEYIDDNSPDSFVLALGAIFSVFAFGVAILASPIKGFALLISVFAVPIAYLTFSKCSLRPWCLGIATLGLLLLYVLEIMPFLTGPAYLMNEYVSLYGQTKIGEQYVDNKAFLKELPLETLSSIRLFIFAERFLYGEALPAGADVVAEFFSPLPGKDPQKVKGVILALVNSDPEFRQRLELYAGGAENLNRAIAVWKKLDFAILRSFYEENLLEYNHQNMCRGQINHLGQIFNPIGEMESGKSHKSIYMQYGLGYTYVMKWTMDLFGGNSIGNVYKTYVYYVLYSLIFCAVIWVVFGDFTFVYLAFAFYSLAFYFQSYIPLAFAPGLIPLVHFMDMPVIYFAARYFKKGGLWNLSAAFLLSLLGVALTHQFGVLLVLPLLVSSLVYVLERYGGKFEIAWRFVFIAFFIALLPVVMSLSDPGTLGQSSQYFFNGFFSWKPHTLLVSLTVIFLVSSYLFLFLIKRESSHLKYLYVFLFVYVQGLFLYFYWSGLLNHFPTVLPFIGLQLTLILFMTYRGALSKNIKIMAIGRTIALVGAFFLTLAIAATARNYYAEKAVFYDNFRFHKTYQWRFSNANLISTVSPDLIADSVKAINKYSGNNEGGVFLISMHDNILYFLSHKYSLMPYFEMQWRILSGSEKQEAIQEILKSKPEYLYVDSNLGDFVDIWGKIYGVKFMAERASRMERKKELWDIFRDVSKNYHLIEKAGLLSVYQRDHS